MSSTSTAAPTSALKVITPLKIAQLCDTTPSANLNSIHAALKVHGYDVGLVRLHRLARYLAEIAHESQGFRYDREIWGPTKAQLGYEGRLDLGNTEPGDGKKFAGRTGMQVTGRHNTRSFYEWCRARFSVVPNFVEDPDLMNTDPWEGLAPIWYWDTRNLNALCDRGDLEGVSRKINGGKNGLRDRNHRYTRIALRLLGYHPDDVRGFQNDAGLAVDGVSGRNTMKALNEKLKRLPEIAFDQGLGARVVERRRTDQGALAHLRAFFFALLTKLA